MLGRRKNETDRPDERSAVGVARTTPSGEHPVGKGRPTPKRRDAQASRKVVAAPTNRRQAAKKARERLRVERAQSRAALMAGDERALPARDRGPVKRFARDCVDARRNVAEYLLPFVLVVFAISIYPNAAVQSVTSLLMLAAIILAVVDSVVLVRSLTRRAGERFPDEDRSGLGRYAIMRSTQIRRLRLPKAKVARGQAV